MLTSAWRCLALELQLLELLLLTNEFAHYVHVICPGHLPPPPLCAKLSIRYVSSFYAQPYPKVIISMIVLRSNNTKSTALKKMLYPQAV